MKFDMAIKKKGLRSYAKIVLISLTIYNMFSITASYLWFITDGFVSKFHSITGYIYRYINKI